jgi:hypothetical protein
MIDPMTKLHIQRVGRRGVKDQGRRICKVLKALRKAACSLRGVAICVGINQRPERVQQELAYVSLDMPDRVGVEIHPHRHVLFVCGTITVLVSTTVELLLFLL